MVYAIARTGTVVEIVRDVEEAPNRPGLEVILVPDGLPVATDWLWNGTTFSPPDGAEVTAELVKRLYYREIDAKTDAIIDKGFEFPPSSGQWFELTLEAQCRMNALLVIASSPLVNYPLRWNFLDDSGYYAIPDAATAQAFCATAISTIVGALDSGTTLKDETRAAETIEDVLAVVDMR